MAYRSSDKSTPPQADKPDRPSIPQPSAEALRRAAPLFAQLMGLSGAERPQSGSSSGRPASSTGPSQMPGAEPQRHYPLAARLLGTLPEGMGVGDDIQDTDFQPSLSVDENPTAPQVLAVPQQPQGFVRKSVLKALTVPQVLLEDVAQMALFDEGSSSSDASFVIVFREELLGELQCRIEVSDQGSISATFIAADSATEALLHAETPRLRTQLERHGLKYVTLDIARA